MPTPMIAPTTIPVTSKGPRTLLSPSRSSPGAELRVISTMLPKFSNHSHQGARAEQAGPPRFHCTEYQAKESAGLCDQSRSGVGEAQSGRSPTGRGILLISQSASRTITPRASCGLRDRGCAPDSRVIREGRVVQLGFGVVHRGQPHGTFKLLFNAIYRSTLTEGDAATEEQEGLSLRAGPHGPRAQLGGGRAASCRRGSCEYPARNIRD